MSSHTPYAVPKDKLGVTIQFESGAVLRGFIFLEYTAARISARQKVSLFLERDNAFFPLLLDDSGRTEFINKNKIRMLEAECPQGCDDEADRGLTRAIHITVVFNDGVTLSGGLLAEVPEQSARLSDCLNLPNRFLSVCVGRNALYINKYALQKVIHAMAT